MTPQLLLKTDNSTNLQILKSDNLVIGGYASIEIVDKQNDLITLDALNEAVKKYMGQQKYRNVMSNHSNVQVGEVLKNYRDSQGKLWKTEVDDVGFFVVIKLRDDIEKAKEIQRGIRKGTLRSFSIGGQALEKRKRVNKSLGEYNEISKLELHEVTICEKGINPEAKFDILKMEKGEKEMSDRLEKALDELNSLLSDINTVSKEEEGEEMMEYMANPEEMEGDKVESQKVIQCKKALNQMLAHLICEQKTLKRLMHNLRQNRWKRLH
jgi:HK97 family phage prohead protease